MGFATTEAGCVIAEFGYGDIIISRAKHPELAFENEICLIQHDSKNGVNTMVPDAEWQEKYANKNSDETDTKVRLVFTNIGGVDALMTVLGELRQGMVEAESSGTQREP